MVSHVVPSEACGGGGASEAAKNQKPIAAVEAKSNRQREIPAESPGLGYGGVVEVKTKNRRLWAALSRDEIEEDVFSTSGNRPSQSTAKEDEDLAEISRCKSQSVRRIASHKTSARRLFFIVYRECL